MGKWCNFGWKDACSINTRNDLSVSTATSKRSTTPAKRPDMRSAYGIPIMPAPTMELTRLEEAPRMEDFFLGRERLLS